MASMPLCGSTCSMSHSLKSRHVAMLPPGVAPCRWLVRPFVPTGPAQPTRAVGRRSAGQARLRVSAAPPEAKPIANVASFMTSDGIITCSPDTTVDKALELLVNHRITGLPVVDQNNSIVGVVSDFDLLALEGMSPSRQNASLFPESDETWDSFYEVQKLMLKNAGKIISDVMTPDPVCVRASTTIEDAANLLLRMRIGRLPVVDDQKRLVGIITRGNIIKAALEARQRMQNE
ncbi:hypothetical protein ACKKBG_A02680 [Auxenochlorella protothecoides x Auxenochlorella symbiontica]|uniref:CBS domain-containing protein n=2 Tax=Auxenochlorella protothecoides TaxID=3075 RepID=A0A1D2A2E5_AUXPR